MHGHTLNFFVKDKERTMRVPKAQSYGIESPMRAPKVRLYGTHPSLHDRAGTFGNNIIWIMLLATEGSYSLLITIICSKK